MRLAYYVVLWCAFGSDVCDLGAESFDARQAAEARLQRWSWLARPLLFRHFTDLEQNKRASRILMNDMGSGPWVPLPERTGCDIKIYNATVNPSTYEWWCRQPIDWLTWCYLEKAGCWSYRNAHYCTHEQAQEASRLLARDLYSLGMPVSWVRLWLAEKP